MLIWLLGILGMPADQPVDEAGWNSFRLVIMAVELILIVLSTAGLLAGYAKAAYRRRLPNSDPGFLFEAFRPMRWLWLAMAPTILMLAIFIWQYKSAFPGGEYNPFGYATLLGLETGLIVLVLSLIGMWFPFKFFHPTPLRFKYRPLLPFVRKPRRGLANN